MRVDALLLLENGKDKKNEITSARRTMQLQLRWKAAYKFYIVWNHRKKKEEEKDGGKSFRIFIVFSEFLMDFPIFRIQGGFSEFSFLKVFIFVMVIMALFYIYFFSIKKIIYIDREKWRWRQSSIQNVWWQWWRQWQRVFKKFIYTKVSYI